jgi:hypothetical protein
MHKNALIQRKTLAMRCLQQKTDREASRFYGLDALAIDSYGTVARISTEYLLSRPAWSTHVTT